VPQKFTISLKCITIQVLTLLFTVKIKVYFMPKYETVIGLEVHTQLSTESKLFCSCSTQFGSEPNENVCEICSAMPGTLPVLNEKAVAYAAQLGMALNCEINPVSIFAAKTIFIPICPKGINFRSMIHLFVAWGIWILT
jgi:aspartyl/glutamyl-tRNA(Asn/Gln) amidotransferase subunit B (EC 6.3.5.-)